MNEPEKDLPGIIAPPPLLYAGTLAVGLLLDSALKLPFVPKSISRIAGTKFLVSGAASFAWGFATMKAAGTYVDPYEPSTTVVENGPFAYSRNPLYLGMSLMYAGIATLRRAPVALSLLPPLLVLVESFVIEREERYLERRFGVRYLVYKSRVRRWL